ncbi:MAG: hypothetical protein VX589_16930 [Myxococcota bacterium]|nr:hypothetical protein [Myxococcota bacterium]
MADFLYIPNPTDTEMDTPAVMLKENFHFNIIGPEAGDAKFAQVTSADTVWMLCHGHEHQPLFILPRSASGRKSWTAAEMATQFIDEGLDPIRTQNMVLLVCHAGESVGEIKEVERLMVLNARARTARADEDEKTYQKLLKAYTALVKKTEPPKHYTRAEQVFPLGAQLYRELYSRGFMNLRMKTFKAAVAKYWCGIGKFEPRLDMRMHGGTWGETLSAHPDYVMVLTAALFKRLGWSLRTNDVRQPIACW